MTAPVDVSKLREGDVVTIRTKVVRFGGGEPVLQYNREAAAIWARQTDIVSVEPRPLKIGDLVMRPRGASGSALTWEVAAIVDNHTLIKSGNFVAHEILSELRPA